VALAKLVAARVVFGLQAGENLRQRLVAPPALLLARGQPLDRVFDSVLEFGGLAHCHRPVDFGTDSERQAGLILGKVVNRAAAS
jgi:hypothetical protein